jgi:hypothetical protein
MNARMQERERKEFRVRERGRVREKEKEKERKREWQNLRISCPSYLCTETSFSPVHLCFVRFGGGKKLTFSILLFFFYKSQLVL